MYALAHNPELPVFALSRGPQGYYCLPGMGDFSLTQGATGVITGGTIGVQTAISTGSMIAGGVAGALAAIAPFTGPAAPFIMAAAALVGPIAALFKGCGQTCVLATQYANQAADAVNQVQNEYFAQPVRTRSSQLAAIGLIKDLMAQLQKACGNPSLGPAGQRCISERLVRGGSAPWCNLNANHTGCDWYTAHIDPIQNDPGVVDDPASTAQVSNVLSSFGIDQSYTPYILLGLALVGIAVFAL